MLIALEITLILALATIVASLVPLLHQLRRSARGLDLFLAYTRKDLAQIAEDVHASRLRMDELACTLQPALADFSTLAKVAGDLGIQASRLHDRYRTSLETTSRWAGGVMGGISTVLAFLNPKPSHPFLK